MTANFNTGFQFLDMVRSNGLCSVLRLADKKMLTTSADVLHEFKVMYSSNQRKRQQEDLVMANLSTALFMLEGTVPVTAAVWQ